MKVTFLSRPGCHLCDEALDALNHYLSLREGEGAGPALDVEVVDIERDDDLHRRFLERIPVILVEDEIVSEFTFEPERMDAAISLRSQGQG